MSHLPELHRAGVRAAFEARFGSERMARHYVALYACVACKLELVQAELPTDDRRRRSRRVRPRPYVRG